MLRAIRPINIVASSSVRSATRLAHQSGGVKLAQDNYLIWQRKRPTKAGLVSS